MEQDSPDPLRPSEQHSLAVYLRSRQVWHTLCRKARRSTRFPKSCIELNNLLNKMPSIPPINISEDASDTTLYIEGFSQWMITSDRQCELNHKIKQSRPYKGIIGVTRPTECKVSSEYLSRWDGFERLNKRSRSRANNYFCPLILGWSYIMSAYLIEQRMQTAEDRIDYTENFALCQELIPGLISNAKDFTIPIGQANESERRWWSAILAKGHGWQANLHRAGKNFYPPWECHLDSGVAFIVLYSEATSLPVVASAAPPSSDDSLKYLYKFARLHNALDQLIAALAATLTIHTHIRFGAPVVLPTPVIERWPGSCTRPSDQIDISYADEFPRFMMLSCIPSIMQSSLFSSIWEPGIACNVASEWLYPCLQEVILPLLEEKAYCSIVSVLAARKENIAPLWLGALVTGLLPRIITVCRSFLPNTCPEASIWTSSSQSFMDCEFYQKPPFVKKSKGCLLIPREDEFRLLYLTDIESNAYGRPPMSPYPPFGLVKLEDAALPIRLHVSCGHKLRYLNWVWQGPDGQTLVDEGGTRQISKRSTRNIFGKLRDYSIPIFTLKEITSVKTCIRSRYNGKLWSDGMSEKATRNCLSWTYFAEGIRLSERQMWDHEWLNIICGKENESLVVSCSSSS
jgi:hypothetical protein